MEIKRESRNFYHQTEYRRRCQAILSELFALKCELIRIHQRLNVIKHNGEL